MHLRELKDKSPTELLTQAEDMGIEDASSMRVQDLVFAIMNFINR
jgi:transcription termination factor Rho